MRTDLCELSREVSYALRHAPWEYELELDAEGWVGAEQLLTALRESRRWQDLALSDLQDMIEASEKKRHALKDGRIRAFYGHTVPMKIQKQPAEPPALLYHGTARRFLPSIFSVGLQPCSRQYVHLSQDTETALQVGRRRDSAPALLIVRAGEAFRRGVRFYLGNEKVWLADSIPAEFLSESENHQDN